VTAKQQKTEVTALSPNEVVRLKHGKKYFGYGPTVLAEKIRAGEIPEPVRLGDRARGWLGSQIIEWQRRLVEPEGKR
jgi:predicted DNA-binding transcriptional regulator AlpA